MSLTIRRVIIACTALGWLAVAAQGQELADAPPPHAESARDTAKEPPKLPPEQTTQHVLELPGRTLKFTATAGSIRLSNDANEPQADLAFIAYQLEGADRATRPVTFAFNGGPGMASG